MRLGGPPRHPGLRSPDAVVRNVRAIRLVFGLARRRLHIPRHKGNVAGLDVFFVANLANAIDFTTAEERRVAARTDGLPANRAVVVIVYVVPLAALPLQCAIQDQLHSFAPVVVEYREFAGRGQRSRRMWLKTPFCFQLLPTSRVKRLVSFEKPRCLVFDPGLRAAVCGHGCCVEHTN